MKQQSYLSNCLKRARVLLIACVLLLLSHAARAQSSGPNVDVCSSTRVDSSYWVELTVCLYGNASGVTAVTSVNDPDAGDVIAGTGAGESLYNASTLVYSGQNRSSGSSSISYTFTPQLNAVYTLNGTSNECYDRTGMGNYGGCRWNYIQGSLSVQAQVTGSAPTVSAWPTASAITYGQTLASSTLSGGTASVGGTFAWTTSSTAPGAGTPSESVTFTPSSTTNYNTVTGSVNVTVNKATPTVSAWPTASAIIYGQTLASSTLSGGTASVGGTFAWTTPSTSPGAGTPSESLTFTPTDSIDYNTVTGSVNVTVNKATPTVSAWPTASAITYGQTLASSTLSGGTASVGGTFAWTTPSTSPGAGTASESVTFTPTDATDYNTVTGSANIAVNKATPTVSAWPTASAITYGQTLASSTLSGGTASVGGTFAWTTSSTAPGAGTPSESVTFTPTDTTNYSTVTGSVNVTVNKATPTVSAWPTASAITYGQTLASSTLSGGTASVGGTFAWTTPSTSPGAGTPSESLTFTPTDSIDYNTVTGSVNVTVNKATPTVSAWPTPSAITYGQTLASSTLSGGTASVGGTFAWTTPSTAPGAGTPSESLTFTPTDATDYNTVTGSVNVTVSVATPMITWATPAAITYGTALSTTQLNASTTPAGTFAYTPASGTVLLSGPQTLSVTFTPTDATDYNTATSSVTLTVNKAVPTITWATPAAITYGTALSTTQLNASSTVAGTFAYTPASGAVLSAGSQTLSVTFTPTDTTDYTTATGSVTLALTDATLTLNVTASNSAPSYSDSVTLTATMSGGFTGTVNPTGTITFYDGSTSIGTRAISETTATLATNTLALGTHTISASYSGDANYNAASAASITLNIGQATPVINWSTPSDITYGTALSVTQLNASASYNGTSIPGTFEYTPASGEFLDSSTHELTVSFTPTDFTNYTSASGSVMLVVNVNPGLQSATIYTYSITSYAPNSNILSYTDSVTGAWSNLGYDSLNRLIAGTQSSISGAPLSVSQSLCWSYDGFGNRLQQASSNLPFTSAPGAACQPSTDANAIFNNSWANYTVDGTSNTLDNGKNQLTATPSGNVTYDAAGSVTYDANSGNSYLYDAEGRVCAVKNQPVQGTYSMTQYIYDAEGARVAKGTITNWSAGCDTAQNGFTVTNAYVLGPSGEQLTETDGNGVWKHTNVYAAGSLIATYDQLPSGAQPLHFQLADWLGTRRVQTDYAGNTEVSFSSLPFGDQPSSLPTALATAEDATEHHFTGKERDTESGNDYFGARYYASSMGRFMSPDWSAKVEPVPYAKLDNPQSLNLYAYVGNNPLSGIDADGHCGKTGSAANSQDGSPCPTAQPADLDKGAQQQNLDSSADAAKGGAQRTGAVTSTNVGGVWVNAYGGTADQRTAELGAFTQDVTTTDRGKAMLSALQGRKSGLFGLWGSPKPFDIIQMAGGGSYSYTGGQAIMLDYHDVGAGYTSASGGGTYSLQRIFAHELGHAAMGNLDNGPGNMNNVNWNENPVMRQLGDFNDRTTY